MTGIIVLNYQTWDLSFKCIKNIIDTQKDMQCHIYLVDNASIEPMPDELKDYLKLHGDIVTFLPARENRGYAAGNNIGIRRALEDGCENLVLTNNDILFQENAVLELVRSLDDEKRIGIVGPKVLDGAGNIQPSRCSMKTGIREIFELFTAAKILFRKKWKQYYCLDQNPEEPSDAYYVSGCCFAMSRACALVVTPLDEGTVLYNEEMILGIRMEQEHYRTVYNPQSVVVHQHGATTEKGKAFMHQCICKSELYYCRKYLHAKRWQLFLLFHYRRGLYWIRSGKEKSLREYWEIFDRETGKWYKSLKRGI